MVGVRGPRRPVNSHGGTGLPNYGKYADADLLYITEVSFSSQRPFVQLLRGVSQPGPADAQARHVLGIDKFMWGSEYPHDEGTWPFTREHLRRPFHDTDPAELRRLRAGNAARLDDFSLDALAPRAAEYGPTVAALSRPLDALPDEPNEALLKAVARSAF